MRYKPGDKVEATKDCDDWVHVGERFTLTYRDGDGDWWGKPEVERLIEIACLGKPTDFRIARRLENGK